MVPSPRVSLQARARSETFRSDEHAVALLTVARVDARGEPVFRTTGPTGFRFLVVVWPADSKGRVIPDRVRAGEARVAPWDLSPAEVEALDAMLAAGWHLGEIDLLVSGGPIRPHLAPSPDTLRASPFWPAPSEDEIARLLADQGRAA